MTDQSNMQAQVQPQPQTENWFNVDLIADIVGIIGTVIGITLNITPAILFWKVLKKIEKARIIPESMLVFNVLCNLLWGVFWSKHERAYVPMASAAISGTLSVIFSIMYMWVIAEESIKNFFFYSLINLDITFQVWYLLQFVIPGYDIIGTIAVVVNIFTYIAPGQNIIKVCKERDNSLIPIVTTIVGCFCSLSWLLFGILKKDIYSVIPNILGISFSILNVSVWTYFKVTSKKKDIKEEELNKVNEDET